MADQETEGRSRQGGGVGTIIGWCVFVGILWAIIIVGLNFYAMVSPDNTRINMLIDQFMQIGFGLGGFISPILQLALIIFIVIGAVQRFGLLQDNRWLKNLGNISSGNNVQAFIAIALIIGLVLGAFADIQQLSTLKDLALVVVGFYFGTRKRQGDVEDAAAAVAEAERRPPAKDPDQASSPTQG